MPTITISKKIIKNDNLVIIPRSEYEKLVRFWTSAEWLTGPQKQAITKGFQEIKQGKFFVSKQVKNELGL